MTTDETPCPLCGKANQCMAGSKQPCWCEEIEIPQQLLEQIPAGKRGKACICRQCIERYRQLNRL